MILIFYFLIRFEEKLLKLDFRVRELINYFRFLATESKCQSWRCMLMFHPAKVGVAAEGGGRNISVYIGMLGHFIYMQWGFYLVMSNKMQSCFYINCSALRLT